MKLSVVSIATNGYTHYWLKMVKSFVENLSCIEEVEFHALTDDVQFVQLNSPQHKKASFVIHEISAEPWPMPTLLRYSYIDAIFEKIRFETVMYIDADMLIHPRFDEHFEEVLKHKQINFVAHPGYWRSKGNQSSGTVSNKAHLWISDFFRKIRLGALGDWESREKSLAYVPRKKRKIYICGGVWFGPRVKIGNMVKTLAVKTQMDLDNGIIAKWHDESHLNCWYVQNGGDVLTPEYCYDPTYAQLEKLIPRIEAVDKGQIKQV